MSKLVLNRTLWKDLAREPWAKEMISDAVDAVEDGAQRNSPLGDDFVGYYGRFVKRSFQMFGTVGSTDVAAHLIEFGSINNPPYAPLRRGVDDAGLRFTDPRAGGTDGEGGG